MCRVKKSLCGKQTGQQPFSFCCCRSYFFFVLRLGSFLGIREVWFAVRVHTSNWITFSWVNGYTMVERSTTPNKHREEVWKQRGIFYAIQLNILNCEEKLLKIILYHAGRSHRTQKRRSKLKTKGMRTKKEQQHCNSTNGKHMEYNYEYM